jgi:hypothetical protein
VFYARTNTLPITCALCGKPISLEGSKVTEDGKAVHGECYYEKIRKRKEQESWQRANPIPS